MNSFYERSRSPWMDIPLPKTGPLAEPLNTDIVIVGAGIAGLSCAYELSSKGLDVIVLERGLLCGGQSSRTSAHLTYSSDDYYYELIHMLGLERAQQYYQSQRAAVDRVEAVAAKEGIDCDFMRVPAYLFAANPRDTKILDKELEGARRAGFAGVELGPKVPGLNSALPALKFPNQARFHPLKYLAGLSAALQRRDVRLFDNTPVVGVDKQDSRVVVTTERGDAVTAEHAIIATNAPINNFAAIHTKQAPYRTYVFAAGIPKAIVIDALIWDTVDPYHYMRIQPREQDDLLIVGGEDHKCGAESEGAERIERLKQWTKHIIGSFADVEYAWSGQIYEPVDYAPFIGHSPGNDNVYVITGDSGEGLTTGVAASLIIPDLIAKGSSPWQDVYVPTRKSLHSIGAYIKENTSATSGMSHHVIGGEVQSLGEIQRGCGARLRINGDTVAVYRDDGGVLHAASATCTHAGCTVEFNSFERCWDCPCHGSQFDVDGNVLAGPAREPLKAIKLEKAQSRA